MPPSGLEPPRGAAVSSQAGRTVEGVPKTYREVRRALADAGWQVVRQRGSHEVWPHPNRRERIVVAGRQSDTVPVGTLGSIRRAGGLEELR
jgi:predicted RNA binding protein YcfA (HicA-like mRNA interferase family)